MDAPTNGMRPIHPGEVLREEFLLPMGLSAHALSMAMHVPAPRINDIVRALLRHQRRVLDGAAVRPRDGCCAHRVGRCAGVHHASAATGCLTALDGTTIQAI